MEAVAKLKNCQMSARKMRLVIDLIRGREVNEALDILRFTKKEAAQWLEKLLFSAIANWEDKNDMAYSADDYDLYIKMIFSDQAPMLKRFRPAPHGRAHRIRKHNCHVTLVVENRLPTENEQEVETVVAEEVAE